MSGGHSSSGIGDAIKKGVGIVHGTGEALRGNFNAAVDSAGGDANSASAQRHRDVAAKGVDEIEYGYHRKGNMSHAAPGETAHVAPGTANVVPGNAAHTAPGNAAHVAPGTAHVDPGHTAHQGLGHTTHPAPGNPAHVAPGNAAQVPPPNAAPTDAQRKYLNTAGSASTNYGSHSTNTGNKLDPRFDSDMDHRGTATGSTNLGGHQSNVGNKLDPRIDSDGDHRANPGSVVR